MRTDFKPALDALRDALRGRGNFASLAVVCAWAAVAALAATALFCRQREKHPPIVSHARSENS